MARFDKDFRPDKQTVGFFQRFHLTRKQRLSLARWGLYGALLLILSVVQDVILCHLDIWGGTTNLVLAAIFTVALMEDVEQGSVFCLAAAAFYQFSGAGAGYHIIFLIPVLGVIGAIFRQNYLRKGFSATFLCGGSAVMVYELTVFVIALFLRQTHAGRLTAALVTGALSVLCIPLLYPIVVSIGKIGGETWKE